MEDVSTASPKIFIAALRQLFLSPIRFRKGAKALIPCSQKAFKESGNEPQTVRVKMQLNNACLAHSG
jgi:hypothetical protein